MSALSPIDVPTAWELVRSVRPGSGGEAVRVAHPEHGEIRLEVDPDGGWSSSVECSNGARDLFDLYLPLRVRSEFVIAQLGQSLDGRIATESGHSFYVTGPDDIRRLHRLRALVDAVVIGASTAIHDNPRLTVREVTGENPARVILDPEGRVGEDNRALMPNPRRAIVLRRRGLPASSDSCDVIELPTTGDIGFSPGSVIEALRERGLRRLLIEGGGVTVSRFVTAGALDRLHVTIAPLLLGSGRPSLTLPPIATVDEAIRPRFRRFELGDDLLFDLELRLP